MIHISTFSGIGGFEIAAQWMGWRNLVSCDINEFGNKVRKYHWPEAYHHTDIKTLTYETINTELTSRYGTHWRDEPIILTGGFPCQPFSVAGKQLGTEDDRHLWPEMLRVIREVAPEWIVGENVRGLVNWSKGLVFEQVQADLEAEGYEVLPFILPACAVNAPHRRDRVWFIAHATSHGSNRASNETSGKAGGPNGESTQQFTVGSKIWPTSDTESTERKHTGDSRTGWAGFADGCSNDVITDPSNLGRNNGGNNREERHIQGNKRTTPESESERDGRIGRAGEAGSVVTDTMHNGLQGRGNYGELRKERANGNKRFEDMGGFSREDWQNFPTQSPVRSRDDGFSRSLVRYITQELYYEISKTSKENRIENLQEVWERVSSPEVWDQIRGLYSLESKDLLFQTMQLYSTGRESQVDLSPFSEEVSKGPLRTLQKYGEFRGSPQGQKLEKQRSEQFGDSLSFLPHEVALAAKAYTDSIRKFETWHRQESIKAYGNAVVPPLVFEIFKAIEAYENLSDSE